MAFPKVQKQIEKIIWCYTLNISNVIKQMLVNKDSKFHGFRRFRSSHTSKCYKLVISSSG